MTNRRHCSNHNEMQAADTGMVVSKVIPLDEKEIASVTTCWCDGVPNNFGESCRGSEIGSWKRLRAIVCVRSAMASVHPTSDLGDPRTPVPCQRPADYLDAEMLHEENRQLRELVIQLSKLVIRNAMDRK